MPPRRLATSDRRASGGDALVVVEAAEVPDGDDPAVARRLSGAWDGGILVQRQVSPPSVVVGEVCLEMTAQHAFIPDDDVIDALTPSRPDETFDVRILPRRPRRDEDLLDPKGLFCVAECLAVDPLPIADDKLGASSHGQALRICWAVQATVRCAVTLTIRRRSWDKTTNTKGTRRVAVGTVKKSSEANRETWLDRNVRQVWDGGVRGQRPRYFATVAWLIAIPNVRHSPCTRGAPHSGLAVCLSRISPRTSASMAGRPGPRERGFHSQ